MTPGGGNKRYRLQKTEREIYDKADGTENLVSAVRCAARPRLMLADNAKRGSKAAEDTDSVKGVFRASDQLQIIPGAGVTSLFGLPRRPGQSVPSLIK